MLFEHISLKYQANDEFSFIYAKCVLYIKFVSISKLKVSHTLLQRITVFGSLKYCTIRLVFTVRTIWQTQYKNLFIFVFTLDYFLEYILPPKMVFRSLSLQS